MRRGCGPMTLKQKFQNEIETESTASLNMGDVLSWGVLIFGEGQPTMVLSETFRLSLFLVVREGLGSSKRLGARGTQRLTYQAYASSRWHEPYACFESTFLSNTVNSS